MPLCVWNVFLRCCLVCCAFSSLFLHAVESVDRVSQRIPSSKDVDPLVEIDRNVRKLEVFLTNSAPPMTVADMKRFLPCTINVDPYLRKLIRGKNTISFVFIVFSS